MIRNILCFIFFQLLIIIHVFQFFFGSEEILGSMDDKRATTRLLITPHEFSKIIGKGGSTIMHIRTTCGASVKGFDVDPETRLVGVCVCVWTIVNFCGDLSAWRKNFVRAVVCCCYIFLFSHESIVSLVFYLLYVLQVILTGTPRQVLEAFEIVSEVHTCIHCFFLS